MDKALYSCVSGYCGLSMNLQEKKTAFFPSAVFSPADFIVKLFPIILFICYYSASSARQCLILLWRS